MLHDQIRTACPFPYCMSMSILHVRVHVEYPFQCCMSIYIYKEMPDRPASGQSGTELKTTLRYWCPSIWKWTKIPAVEHFPPDHKEMLQCWSSVTPFVTHGIEIVDFRRGGCAHRLLQPFYEDPYVVVSAGPKFFFAIGGGQESASTDRLRRHTKGQAQFSPLLRARSRGHQAGVL